MKYFGKNRWSIVAHSMILLAVLFFFSNSTAQLKNGLACETDNSALRKMPAAKVTFTRTDGSKLNIQVKLAATASTRAAGFQRVCPSVVEMNPILFVFRVAHVPSFHMRNVVTPLDIAFIREDGSVDSIRKMKPYVLGSKKRPLYSSDTSVIAALEVIPGFYEENQIDLRTEVKWQLLQ